MVVASSRYKYNPDDFHNMYGLSEDLTGFYNSLERYKEHDTFENRIHFLNAWEDVFFFDKAQGSRGDIEPCLCKRT